jgi:hypothetical protein
VVLQRIAVTMLNKPSCYCARERGPGTEEDVRKGCLHMIRIILWKDFLRYERYSAYEAYSTQIAWRELIGGPCYGPHCHMVPQGRSCASKGMGRPLPGAGANADMPRFGAANAAGRGRYMECCRICFMWLTMAGP